jgi:hypothetical protein
VLRSLPHCGCPPEITLDDRTHSVIVRGSIEELEIAEKIVAELDRPSAETVTVYVTRGFGDAASLARLLQTLLRGPNPQRSPPPHFNDDVSHGVNREPHPAFVDVFYGAWLEGVCERGTTSKSKSVRGRIVPSIDDRALKQAGAWGPLLAKAHQPDAGWDWSEFVRQCDQDERACLGKFEAYTLRVRSEVEALMILETIKHRSRVGCLPLVYIEYLAVAPHNRLGVQEPRKYRHCGQAMLALVGMRSKALGYRGRFGLHSLSDAIPFYQGCGMTDHGADLAEVGLHYFEGRGRSV